MNYEEIIMWLISGDVCIQYQTYRDLLNKNKPALQKRIESEGWGAEFLKHRKPNGHWGNGFYQVKWISSHYTILDLRNLCIAPSNKIVKETINKIFDEEKEFDGGINPARTVCDSDICINGMAMNYGAYFKIAQKKFESVVDYILTQQMPDGGFNCMRNRSGAKHSSLHSTISVAEGICEYRKNGYKYRVDELIEKEKDCQEFMLMHQLFKSDKTGKIIKDSFLRLPYPCRWYYDILRAIDYFRYAEVPFDDRMSNAIEVLLKKRKKDGTWPLQAKHPGKLHFEMEQTGKSSRMNTLRALRVLNYYKCIEKFN